MAEMLSITTPSYSDPSGYQLSTVPRPVISDPTDVLIQVHAASINPVDVKLAAGLLKMAVKDEFPYKVGYDCAGVVTEVGDQVTRIKVGDNVWVRLPEITRGSWSEFAKSVEYYVARKPESLSFEEAASLPLAAVTALQALRKYKGSLSGKTVFVPAGLGGTGAYACQLAKNVFHAGKVITTVSTSKVAKVPELLGEGVVDQGQSMQFLSLMVPSTGTIISVSTQPSGTQLQESSLMRRTENPQLPLLARLLLNATDAVRKARAKRWGVTYQYLFLESNAKDLDILSGYVEERSILPVIGSKLDLRDIEKVREACDLVYKGKGGIGKTVFRVYGD